MILLNPAATTLAPGQSETISWTLFWHNGWDEFFAKASKTPQFTRFEASQYSFAQGEATTITASGSLHHLRLTDNGQALPIGNTHTKELKLEIRPSGLGDHVIRSTADERDTFLRLSSQTIFAYFNPTEVRRAPMCTHSQWMIAQADFSMPGRTTKTGH